MADNKITGYKKVFGVILPDWINEGMIRNFVTGLLLIVIMFFVLIFVIWPRFETVTARSTQLMTSQQDLETLRSSSEGLERIRADLTARDQERVLTAMSTDYSPDGAVYLLRRISADSGVSIVSYSLPAGELLTSSTTVAGKTGEMVDFVAYPIRMTVAAPVESLLVFISKVESSLPFGVVADLNLQEVTRLSRSATDKTVQLALEIRFYQSVLRTININKLQSLTTENLSLAKELAGYNFLVIPEETTQQTVGTVNDGSGSIFGF